MLPAFDGQRVNTAQIVLQDGIFCSFLFITERRALKNTTFNVNRHHVLGFDVDTGLIGELLTTHHIQEGRAHSSLSIIIAFFDSFIFSRFRLEPELHSVLGCRVNKDSHAKFSALTSKVHEGLLGVRASSILPLCLFSVQGANGGWLHKVDVRRHIGENEFESVSLCCRQICSINRDEGTPTSEARKVRRDLFPVGFGEVEVDDELLFNEWVFEIDRQFDEALPDVQLVRDTNERLEQSDCAGWVLRCQVKLILNCLLNFAILIIGLNNDALLLRYNHLNVHPFVKWQEYRV